MNVLRFEHRGKLDQLGIERELTHRLLDLEESGEKLRVAAHSLSEDSSESSHMTKLIDELLENAATIVDCVDERYFDGNEDKAAQARFNRLIGFNLSTYWLSDSRKMKLPDGSIYNAAYYDENEH